MMSNLQRSGEQVLSDMQYLLSDMSRLLDALKAESLAGSSRARVRDERALQRARVRQESAPKRATEASDNAHAYVPADPWRMAGVAAATGMALGAVIGGMGRS